LPISKIYIDQAVSDSPVVKKITSCLSIPFETVPNSQHIYQIVSDQADPVSAGKQVLFLTENKGPFIRKCPGTHNYTCCDYQILHIGTFCTMDCSYCILQAYFHPPVLQYFVNHDALKTELRELFEKETISRIGTGEFTDSLIWEVWTDTSEMLVPMFAAQERAVLELKTKTTHVAKMGSFDHKRKTILSWSLNTPAIIRSEERKTSSLQARLSAARTCEQMGYPLAFHFDPVFIYEGCESDYQKVVKDLFDAVSKENITYISIGSFRYMPSIYHIIERRFPQSRILYGEFVTGLDGKMRYFKPLRMRIYKVIIDAIRKFAPDVLVYFCMEDDEVWNTCMGFLPTSFGGLGHMLDRRVQKICHLKS